MVTTATTTTCAAASRFDSETSASSGDAAVDTRVVRREEEDAAEKAPRRWFVLSPSLCHPCALARLLLRHRVAARQWRAAAAAVGRVSDVRSGRDIS